jgi:hypothetical protein
VSDDGASPPEEPSPLQRALNLIFFAPVGMALTAVEDLPGLVARGRQEVANARIVGKFVVDQGQAEVVRRLGGLLGRADAEEPSAPAASGPTPTAGPAPAPEPPPPPPPRPAPDPADNAIVERALADYDTLSASQVVRRLENLGPDELRAVHRHEASHRNRRTILNRTTQLLDTTSGPAAAAD